MPAPFPGGRSVGWIAVIITIALWVTFALSARAISFSNLTAIDVALIRYSVPIVLLGFALPRSWKKIRSAPPLHSLLIAFGAGLPFFLLTAQGSALSSATFVGVINPAMPAIYVALFALVVWKVRLSGISLVGYGAILLGIGLMIAASPASLRPSGAVLLLLAALCWAIYTIGMQRSGLDAISAALLMCIPTAIASLVLVLFVDGTSHLSVAPWREILFFIVVQGVGTGVISTLAYATAIRHLGVSTASTSVAISPAMTAIAATFLFGETISHGMALGIAIVIAGILSANAGRRYRLQVRLVDTATAT